MRKMSSILLAIAGISIVLGGGANLSFTSHVPADFSLKTYDAKEITLGDFRGEKGVVLVFFASWCNVSADQVKPLKEFVEKTKGKEVVVLGVSIQEKSKVIEAFAKKKDLSYPVLLDETGAVAVRFGIQAIPTIIGINTAGEVVHRGHDVPEEAAPLVDLLTEVG